MGGAERTGDKEDRCAASNQWAKFLAVFHPTLSTLVQQLLSALIR
jgi:hypothetical protein